MQIDDYEGAQHDGELVGMEMKSGGTNDTLGDQSG